jgi:serine/threonine protein kinase
MLKKGSLFQRKYRIGDKLGEGGMGVVYAAVQEPSGLPVAIKLILAKDARGLLKSEQGLREAKVLAKLNHNNLVRLIDFDQTEEGDCYLVMELVDGDTLDAHIMRAKKRGERLDPLSVLLIGAQVAEGIEAAHKAGIVHRDLKPQNIIVSDGPIARVVDFGIAKNPAKPVSRIGAETDPAHVMGTPLYMAPEQILGKPIDARTDIYALGVVLYVALTGCFPYERESEGGLEVTEIMARHCHAEPTPIDVRLPGCSKRVVDVVLRCLEKDPKDRYASARELARELRAAFEEEKKHQQQEQQQEQLHAHVARETGSISPAWTPGAVLPFVSANAARVMRPTDPMPATGPNGPPQPTYAATKPRVLRGVGHTTKMVRPNEASLSAARELATAAPTAPPVEAVERAARSSTSGVHRRLPSAPQPGSSSPPEVAQPREASMMQDQPVLRAKPAPRRAPPLFVAPVVGSVLAVVLVVLVMKLRPSRASGELKESVPPPSATIVAVPPPPAPSESPSAIVVLPTSAPPEPSSLPALPSAAPAPSTPRPRALPAPRSAPHASAPKPAPPAEDQEPFVRPTPTSTARNRLFDSEKP